MVALPDFEREFAAPPLTATAEESGATGTALDPGRLFLRLAGTVLVLASLGLWLLPSVASDPAMMLVKLLFCFALFWAGLLAFHAARLSDPRPEVQIDRKGGQLRILHPAQGRSPARCIVHRLDDLAELSLRDGLLSARDRGGRLVVALEIAGDRSARNLQKALSFAA